MQHAAAPHLPAAAPTASSRQPPSLATDLRRVPRGCCAVLQVAGETEVKAQIKLRFIASTRQPVVIIRSFQLTQASSGWVGGGEVTATATAWAAATPPPPLLPHRRLAPRLPVPQLADPLLTRLPARLLRSTAWPLPAAPTAEEEHAAVQGAGQRRADGEPRDGAEGGALVPLRRHRQVRAAATACEGARGGPSLWGEV